MLVSLKHGGWFVTAVLLILAAVAFASGCGGSGADSQTASSGTTAELSKAEFVNRASTVCKAAQERTTEEFGKYVHENRIPTSGPGVEEKAVDAFRIVFRPAIEKEIEVLRELEPPKSDQQQVDAILTAMQQGLEKAEENPLQFIQTSSTLIPASRLATAYGLPACSANSS